jgi:hypothetical protein
VPHQNGFSVRLRAKAQLARDELFRDAPSPRGRAESREHYKEYLFTLHSVIRSSVPLMQAAEKRCRGPGDSRLLSPLAKYYRKHTREERNHDRWLLADLELIGVPRQETLSRRPVQAVAELVGSQYYWIHHFHPVCLLGYVAVLEGYPPRAGELENLRIQTGYPGSAFRTLAGHSSLDPQHREEMYDMLDSLPLDKRHEEWITLNAIYTLGKWKEIIDLLNSEGETPNDAGSESKRVVDT